MAQLHADLGPIDRRALDLQASEPVSKEGREETHDLGLVSWIDHGLGIATVQPGLGHEDYAHDRAEADAEGERDQQRGSHRAEATTEPPGRQADLASAGAHVGADPETLSPDVRDALAGKLHL